MSGGLCYLCGNEATGLASIWDSINGERHYCHGDADAKPTCYERAMRAPKADTMFSFLSTDLSTTAPPTEKDTK